MKYAYTLELIWVFKCKNKSNLTDQEPGILFFCKLKEKYKSFSLLVLLMMQISNSSFKMLNYLLYWT